MMTKAQDEKLRDYIQELQAENERLEAGWMEFESIALEGKLQPSVKDLLRALEETREDNKWLREEIELEREACARTAVCSI